MFALVQIVAMLVYWKLHYLSKSDFNRSRREQRYRIQTCQFTLVSVNGKHDVSTDVIMIISNPHTLDSFWFRAGRWKRSEREWNNENISAQKNTYEHRVLVCFVGHYYCHLLLFLFIPNITTLKTADQFVDLNLSHSWLHIAGRPVSWSRWWWSKFSNIIESDEFI